MHLQLVKIYEIKSPEVTVIVRYSKGEEGRGKKSTKRHFISPLWVYNDHVINCECNCFVDYRLCCV